MSDTLYPQGSPVFQTDAPPDPSPDLDAELQRQQAEIRRRRSPFEPPSDFGLTPQFVPKGMFKQAAAQDILIRGQSLAARHDALDLALNAQVDSAREVVSGFSDLSDLSPPEQRVLDPMHFEAQFLQRRTMEALGQMQRTFTGGNTIWTPPTEPVPLRDPNAPDSALAHMGVIVANAQAAYHAQPMQMPGDMRVQPTVEPDSYEARLRARTYASPIASPGEAAGWLGVVAQSANVAGAAFDGKAQWRSMVANTVAAVQTGAGTHGDYDAAVTEANKRFDALFNDLPRPAQLFFEEMNAGNIGLALAGGPAARVIKAATEGAPLVSSAGYLTGSGGLHVLASLVDSGFASPVKALAYTIGGNIATRGAYEATEGAPGIVRVGAAALAGLGVVGIGEGAQAGVRSLAHAGEDIPILGYPRANELPPTLRAAVGDGGAIKVGNPEEMLEPITQEVNQTWRDGGDVLALRFLPGFGARNARPAGNKAIVIPDILPVQRPTTVQGVVSQAALIGGRAVEQLRSVTERAADLAAQYKTTVPEGIMHAVERGQTTLADYGQNPVFNFFNGASGDPVVRAAALAQKQARTETAARIAPSRAQFLGRVKELFGSTDKLPERIQYIGPADRPLFGAQVAADAHPLTGTIRDFFENPSFYDDNLSKYLPEFVDYDARNTAVSGLVGTDFGVPPGEYETGIGTGGHGVFFPNYDAGEGRVARGAEAAVNSPGSTYRGRTYETMTARLAEADQQGFVPVTDIAESFTRLDAQKIRRAEGETFRYAVGGSRTPVPGWQEVAPLEQLTGDKVWLPIEQAQAATKWLTSRENWLANRIEELKGFRLNGDTSPLTIGGMLGWASHSVSSSRDMLGGLATGLRQGNPLRAATRDALFQDMAAAPERWLPFLTHMGITPGTGTPAEYRAGLLERIPLGIGKTVSMLNEGMSNMLLRGMEHDFNETTLMEMRHGLTLDEARAEAANAVKTTWLASKADELGLNALRRSAERGSLISPTYARNPIDQMAHATAGLLKLASGQAGIPGTSAQWDRLTAREVTATMRTVKMFGTFTGIAAISAAVTAHERGFSPEDAVKRAVLDVNGPDWMVAQLGHGISVPLSGPFRPLMRAMAPGDLDGIPHVPFAGMVGWHGYLAGRVTTPIQTLRDLIQNQDFQGNRIYTEDNAFQIVQALGYLATNSLPVFMGQPLDAAFRNGGQTRTEALTEAAWQFTGQNARQANEQQVLEQERRLGAQSLYALPSAQKVALGMTPEQATVAGAARSLVELRTLIGSRAANAAAEMANPNVAGAKDAYIVDLRRRADNGDQNAEALLASEDAQEKLRALAQQDTKDGLLDRVAYRTARGPIIDQMVGKSAAFKAVFDQMRQSGSPVDRASAQWYDLFNKTVHTENVNGRDVTTNVDYDAFNMMEEQFFASMDPKMATLVQQNVAVAPTGAGPAEVELRQMRHDLTASGYWKIDDTLWEKFHKPLADALGKPGQTNVPEDLRAALADTPTFAEFRTGVVDYISKQLVSQAHFKPETALPLAKTLFQNISVVQQFDRGMQGMKAEWAQDHIADGVAEKAVQWGYLSDSALNLAASGAVQGSSTDTRRSTAPATRPTPAPSLNPLAPRSQAIETPLNDRLFAEHAGGASYGELAIKYADEAPGLTRAAVIGRINRMRDAQPQQVAASVVVNKDESGRPVSVSHTRTMPIVRDESGRIVGLA